MTKIHYGKYGFGTVFVFCGNQGGLKSKNNIPSAVQAKMFAYFLAVEPDMCCQHCAKHVKEKFPNSVRKAAENPEEFAKLHNLM